MKKFFRFLPYFLYLFGFVFLLLPTVYLKVGNNRATYNFFELTFGKDMCDFSVGLFIVFLLLLSTLICSVVLSFKDNKILTNIAIILGITTGVMLFFQRILSNPSVTDLSVHIGLILPGIFIIIGTILLFINNKILNK